MPAIWWHFLVSGRMSSPPLKMLVRLTHTEQSWYDRLWSLPLCLCLLLFPQWTSAYVDPHPPWKSRTKIHEMRCQILLSLWHGGEGKKKKKSVTEEEQKKKKEEKEVGKRVRTVGRYEECVWLEFTADGRINHTAIKAGQAFATGTAPRRLRSQITPWRHFTL